MTALLYKFYFISEHTAAAITGDIRFDINDECHRFPKDPRKSRKVRNVQVRQGTEGDVLLCSGYLPKPLVLATILHPLQ